MCAMFKTHVGKSRGRLGRAGTQDSRRNRNGQFTFRPIFFSSNSCKTDAHNPNILQKFRNSKNIPFLIYHFSTQNAITVWKRPEKHKVSLRSTCLGFSVSRLFKSKDKFHTADCGRLNKYHEKTASLWQQSFSVAVVTNSHSLTPSVHFPGEPRPQKTGTTPLEQLKAFCINHKRLFSNLINLTKETGYMWAYTFHSENISLLPSTKTDLLTTQVRFGIASWECPSKVAKWEILCQTSPPQASFQKGTVNEWETNVMVPSRFKQVPL